MAESVPASRLARPRWRDTRLLVGVLLVMSSIVVGSRVLAGADRTEQVWAAGADLAAGTTLTAGDLQPRAVRLGSVSGNYLRVAAGQPLGATLARNVSAGDLVPAAALAPPGAGSAGQARQVTVPVAAFHYPDDLARGRVVDVYVTPTAAGGSVAAAPTPPVQLVAGAVVVAVEDNGSSGLGGGANASIGVVLSVPGPSVAALVAGLHQGPIDLVRVSER